MAFNRKEYYQMCIFIKCKLENGKPEERQENTDHILGWQLGTYYTGVMSDTEVNGSLSTGEGIYLRSP